jgi:hypothetical protein
MSGSHSIESPGEHPAQYEPPAERRCTNCGAEVVDVYCAHCGEKQPGHHDYAVSHFVHHAFHELIHLDSKLFTTLGLLVTKPGLLAAEYFGGRKTRYIAPLRLFLTLFALQLIAYTVYKPVAIYSLEGAKMAGGSRPRWTSLPARSPGRRTSPRPKRRSA